MNRSFPSSLRLLAFLLPVVLAGCGSPEQNAQKYYESGMALIEKGDNIGARGELLKAIKYKSDKVEVWRALAVVDERTNSQSLAITVTPDEDLNPVRDAVVIHIELRIAFGVGKFLRKAGSKVQRMLQVSFDQL